MKYEDIETAAKKSENTKSLKEAFADFAKASEDPNFGMSAAKEMKKLFGRKYKQFNNSENMPWKVQDFRNLVSAEPDVQEEQGDPVVETVSAENEENSVSGAEGVEEIVVTAKSGSVEVNQEDSDEKEEEKEEPVIQKKAVKKKATKKKAAKSD